jgi:hypothetical protein
MIQSPYSPTNPHTQSICRLFLYVGKEHTVTNIIHLSLVRNFFQEATAPVGQGLLSIEDSRSHSDTPLSVGLLWTSDQPDAEISV